VKKKAIKEAAGKAEKMKENLLEMVMAPLIHVFSKKKVLYLKNMKK